MRSFNRLKIILLSVFALCWIPLDSQVVFAQNQVPAPVTPGDLISSWEANREALGRIRSYEGTGKLVQKTLPGVLGKSAYPHTVYLWVVKRNGLRFLWDVTDGRFTWNPRDDPAGFRRALAYDGVNYSYLDRSRPLKSTSEAVPPEGFDASLPFMNGQRSIGQAAPLEKTPFGLLSSTTGRNEQVLEKDTTPVSPHEVRSAITRFPPYPLEPTTLMQDPFGEPVRGLGNLSAVYRKYLAKLSVTEEKTPDGEPLWHLQVTGPQLAPDVWIPESVWFKRVGSGYLPWRLRGYAGKETGNPDAGRVAEIRQYEKVGEGWYPARVVTTFQMRQPGMAKLETYMTETRELQLSRVNDSFDGREFRIDFPPYARVLHEGRERQATAIPPSHFHLWIRYAVIAVVGIAAVGLLVLLLRRGRPTSNAEG